jgi:outer membrane protein OmpA-like peptidoglycan-associated protein
MAPERKYQPAPQREAAHSAPPIVEAEAAQPSTLAAPALAMAGGGPPDNGTLRALRRVRMNGVQAVGGNRAVQRVVQRQHHSPQQAPAAQPSFRLGPSALTAGMGERIMLTADIQGVDRSHIGGTIFEGGRDVFTVPEFPDARQIARRRQLTVFAARSGSLRIGFDYNGETIYSNPVQITVEDPRLTISPEDTLVDKGGRERFTTSAEGIFDRRELGATITSSGAGINFPQGTPNIANLAPTGTLDVQVAEAGTFQIEFDYYGHPFTSNEVSVGTIEPSVALAVDSPHYFLGETFTIGVSFSGIGDPEQLGATITSHSSGIELGSVPDVAQLLDGGGIQARITAGESTNLQLAFDYMGARITSEPLTINVLTPRIVAAPMELSVGTRQHFPVRFQLEGFAALDQIGATILEYTAPISSESGFPVPTDPHQAGEIIFHANESEGSGTLTLGLDYMGQQFTSPPITINVTTGPSASSAPDRIFFDTDKADIRPDAVTALAQVAQVLHENPTRIVKLEGHADTRHTDDHNLRLSLRRAEETRRHLITMNGVSPAQVPEEHVIAWGESLPAVTPETNPDEFQANRRVEIIMAEGPQGDELAPTIQLTPQSIRAGVGQRFGLRYSLDNLHDADQFNGSILHFPTGFNLLESELPVSVLSEQGSFTLQAADRPGTYTIALDIAYGGQTYRSNTVSVEVVGPTIELSPTRYEDLEIGDFFAFQYTLNGMPDPLAYSGSSVQMTTTGGQGEVVLLRGQPDGLTGSTQIGGLQMHATHPGEVELTLAIAYNGQVYTSNPVQMIVHPKRYRNFSIRILSGGEGGEVVGGGAYSFQLRENGPGGRSGIATFVGGGLTGGAPAGGFGPGSWSEFTTNVPMRLEDFEGGGRIASAGVFVGGGGGLATLVFYCGDKPTQKVEGLGFGSGLAAGASWFHGYWSIQP